MKGLNTFLKILVALTAIAAAAAAISCILRRKSRQMDELDAYLMGTDGQGEPEESIEETSAPQDYLKEDFDQLGSLDQGEVVTISLMADLASVQAVQEQLASEGYSSTYDHEGRILDLTLTGPKDEQEIDQLAKDIKAVIKSYGVEYIGYALD